MRRREFVAWSGTVLTIGPAGCSTLGSGARDGVVLTHVELGNGSDERQVFDVFATYDGEVLHWRSHEVEARESDEELGGEVVEIDPPEEPGNVEVYVRVGENWERTDFDEFDGKRVIVTATYGWPERGMLRLSRIESDRPASTDE